MIIPLGAHLVLVSFVVLLVLLPYVLSKLGKNYLLMAAVAMGMFFLWMEFAVWLSGF